MTNTNEQKETFFTTYSEAVNWLHNDFVLCNNIVDVDESIWDNMRFSLYDEETENADAILNEAKGKDFIKVDESKCRICPACNSIMVKNGAKGGVKIDVCNVCGAKFLDHGELEKIRDASRQSREEGLQETYTISFTP